MLYCSIHYIVGKYAILDADLIFFKPHQQENISGAIIIIIFSIYSKTI